MSKKYSLAVRHEAIALAREDILLAFKKLGLKRSRYNDVELKGAAKRLIAHNKFYYSEARRVIKSKR